LKENLEKFDLVFIVFVSFVYLFSLLLTLNKIGLTLDENVYFSASDSYINWYKELKGNFTSAISKEKISLFWSNNNEHPPFSKILSGIGWYIFSEKLHLFNYIDSHRLSTIFLSTLMVIVLYLFSLRAFNRNVAIFSTFSLISMPRIFFDSHLAALDIPLASMVVLTTWLFWESLKNYKYTIFAGISLGLTLVTKITSILILPVFLIVILFFYFNKRVKKKGNEISTIFRNFFIIIFLAGITFFIIWPWIWYETPQKLKNFITFHKNHYSLPVYYFGKNSIKAPPGYAIIMAFITIPLILTVSSFIGIFKIFKKINRPENILILLNIIIPLLYFSIPKNSVYDGVRLFIQVFPFIAITCGIGINEIYFIFSNKIPKNKKLLFFLISIIIISSGILALIKTHPYENSYFNSIVGGTKGAYINGMETIYWGECYLEISKWLNENAEKNASVFSMFQHVFEYYQEHGVLRKDFKIDDWGSSTHNKGYYVLLMRQGWFDEKKWEVFSKRKPIYGIYRDGVPICLVYNNTYNGVLDDEGYVINYNYIGDFGVGMNLSEEQLFDTEFIDLSNYTNIEHQNFNLLNPSFDIDPHNSKDYFIWYSYFNIISEEEKFVDIGLKFDDQIKIWKDGELIYYDKGVKGNCSIPALSKIKLKKGDNIFLIKVVEITGSTNFCLRLIESKN